MWPQVRRANNGAVVLHYYLDTYPSVDVIEALDVDAFLTNSALLLPRLRQVLSCSAALLLDAALLTFKISYRHTSTFVIVVP